MRASSVGSPAPCRQRRATPYRTTHQEFHHDRLADRPARTPLRDWTAAQRFAALFGVVFLVVAIAGFALTGFSDFAGHHSRTLVIFAVNPLHNTIHLVLAVAWLAAAPRHRTARVANLAIGVVLRLVTVLGFFEGLGMLGMSGLADPDNFLHLLTATLALYFGSVAAGTSDRAGFPASVR